jgi:DNA-binding transcriptional ArsR family regulator
MPSQSSRGSDDDAAAELGALRALAHPFRLQLLEALSVNGPASVSMLADRFGTSVASVSYHLRQLGGHGLIEPAPELARDGRERWWRRRPAPLRWSNVDFRSAPRRQAARALQESVLAANTRRMQTFLREADDGAWDEPWLDAAIMDDNVVYAAPSDLAAIQSGIREILERYKEPLGDGAASACVVVTYAVPVKGYE